MKNNGFFTDGSYGKIYPSDSKPASIYVLPKSHKLNINKDNLYLRPVISSIATYNYNLSKFLTNLIAPVISTTNCSKDSFTFCEKIKKVRATNKFLISYDVCSIPLKETIDTAVDLLFEHNPDFKTTKNEFKKLFDFATSGTHFLFDGSFYDQIDGVAMGSPLGPVLANLFMGYHEANWLQIFKDCEIILYRRYVDDIICLFNSESDADKFYKFLNKQHPNIKFTFEKQQNNQISFLGILIKNNGENFSTTNFRKTKATVLFTNYLGFTLLSYKIGLVKTLIHCAFKICSNWCLFHDEVNNIKKYLEKNSYPMNFICEKQIS